MIYVHFLWTVSPPGDHIFFYSSIWWCSLPVSMGNYFRRLIDMKFVMSVSPLHAYACQTSVWVTEVNDLKIPRRITIQGRIRKFRGSCRYYYLRFLNSPGLQTVSQYAVCTVPPFLSLAWLKSLILLSRQALCAFTLWWEKKSMYFYNYSFTYYVIFFIKL